MSLHWKGDMAKFRMTRASILGINRVMSEAVFKAKHEHQFTNRSTDAEKSIQIAQPAAESGNLVRGFWGSMMLRYFIYLEMGTRFTKSRTSIRERMRIMRTGVFKRPLNAGAPPWNGGSWSPTLRPVAFELYPRLAEYIRQAWKGVTA
jgi:hypothetical protein